MYAFIWRIKILWQRGPFPIMKNFFQMSFYGYIGRLWLINLPSLHLLCMTLRLEQRKYPSVWVIKSQLPPIWRVRRRWKSPHSSHLHLDCIDRSPCSNKQRFLIGTAKNNICCPGLRDGNIFYLFTFFIEHGDTLCICDVEVSFVIKRHPVWSGCTKEHALR